MGFPTGTMFVTVPTPSWARCVSAVWRPQQLPRRTGDCLDCIGKSPAPQGFCISFCLAGRGRPSCSTLHICHAAPRHATPRCASMCVSRGGSASVHLFHFSWERSFWGFSRLIICGRLLSDVCCSRLTRAMKLCSNFHSCSKRQRSCCRAGHEPGFQAPHPPPLVCDGCIQFV